MTRSGDIESARRSKREALLDAIAFVGVLALAVASVAYALAVFQSQSGPPRHAPGAQHAPAAEHVARSAQEPATAGRLPASAAPRIVLEHERTADGEDYVLATIAAPWTGRAAPQRDIVFAVDSSAAMTEVHAQTRLALDAALERLRPGDRFNIVVFADAERMLFDAPRAATPANRAAARRFLAGPMSRESATGFLPALKAALADADSGASGLRQVVLITGSAVEAEARAIAAIADARGRSRLYTLGIGQAPDPAFLRRAAELGRGAHLHVAAAHQTGARLDALLHRLERPVVTHLRVQWPAGVRADALPDPLPDIFAGEPMSLAAHLSSLRGDLLLSGRFGGQAWEARVRFADAHTGAGIAKLWARRKIAALQARRFAGQDTATVEAAVREVALKHGLAGEAGAGAAAIPAADTHAGLRAAPAPAGPNALAAYRSLAGDRLAAIVFLALMFAGMCGLTFSLWRHLRREYASPRRVGWRL